jgi:hypothetical protein
VFPVHVPALRERRDDIPLLVEYFVERYARRAGKRFRHIKKKTLGLFQAYNWPGNIRELQNVVERAVILCDEETFAIDDTWLKPRSDQPFGQARPRTGILAEAEKEFSGLAKKVIEAALAECQGRIAGPRGLLTMSNLAVSGREAERLGLVERCAPPGQAFDEALQVARDIAASGPKTVRLLKKNPGLQGGELQAELERNALQQAEDFLTAEYRARIAHYLPNHYE